MSTRECTDLRAEDGGNVEPKRQSLITVRSMVVVLAATFAAFVVQVVAAWLLGMGALGRADMAAYTVPIPLWLCYDVWLVAVCIIGFRRGWKLGLFALMCLAFGIAGLLVAMESLASLMEAV